MQFIIFIYKEFRPILLSGLKIESFQKCEHGYVACLLSIDKKIYVTSGSDVYSKMMQYGTSTTFFHSKERMHEINVWRKKSRTKKFGNSPRLRPGTKIIQENNLFTLKKNKGNQSVIISRVKRRIEWVSCWRRSSVVTNPAEYLVGILDSLLVTNHTPHWHTNLVSNCF
jgi:hypothetical protein